MTAFRSRWRRWRRRAAAVVAAAMVVTAGTVAAAAEPEWWEVREPAPMPAQVIGGYSRGCLAGGVALPLDGPGYHVMRPSRGRFYGHPKLIRVIRLLAEQMRAEGWTGLLVGDLAQPRGGPMRSGHRSHQTGLDADIWFRPAPRRPLAAADRDSLSAVSVVAENGQTVDDGHWTAADVTLLRTAAAIPEVARIFVNPAIKRRLCRTVVGDRRWLTKIRPWWGHRSHFHVRLRCPEGDMACVDQPPPPTGDGCDVSLAWWFSEEAARMLKERARRPPAPRLTLDDLPPGCRSVLTAP